MLLSLPIEIAYCPFAAKSRHPHWYQVINLFLHLEILEFFQ